MGLGRRRIVRFEGCLQYPVVRSWYNSKKSQQTMIYRLVSFIDWRRTNGLPTDPEEWIRECLHETDLTLITHARAIEDPTERLMILQKHGSLPSGRHGKN